MKIKGNRKIVSSLNRAIEKKSLVQSYLFCGPQALGKFLIAKEFAERVTGWQDEVVNPNLLIIEPELEENDGVFREKEIKLEAIKRLQREFSLTSFSKNYRVAIIRSAEKLNLSAQNALLKILEEPPENTMIILVVENEKKILPTLVSRCQIKRFNLLSEEELAETLDTTLLNREELIFWSFGRPGFLENFLHSKTKLEERREIVKELQSLFSMDGNEKLLLAESLSKNIPALLEKLDIWVVILRSVILNKNFFVAISPLKALGIIEKVEESKQLIANTNSNARLVVENLILGF
jgi:DNA polymerase-3 subunit delta'